MKQGELEVIVQEIIIKGSLFRSLCKTLYLSL